MINLFYPAIAILIIFAGTVVINKMFMVKNKRALLSGLIVSFLYLWSITPNTINSYTIIKDKTGKTCDITMKMVYDDFSNLNRYDPFFDVKRNVSNPDSCSGIHYCYWDSPTYDDFEDCMDNKEYVNPSKNIVDIEHKIKETKEKKNSSSL